MSESKDHHQQPAWAVESGSLDAVDAVAEKRIVITGGAGFIGSHLADAFVEANDVTIVDNCSSGTTTNIPTEATFIKGDLRDVETINALPTDVDIIFHQAGIVSVEQSYRSPQVSHDVNVGATLSLLSYAQRVDARLVFASSCAVYGSAETVPISESHPTNPSSPYGVDKLAADHYVRVFGDCYDIPVVVLRYFNVYGPRQSTEYSGVIDVFKRQASNDEPITVHGDGSQSRDFVHVSDIVQANAAAAVTNNVGHAYNVGTGTSVTIAELAEEIRSLVGSSSEIVYTDPRPGDIQQSVADLHRSRNDLGYAPRTELQTGLQSLLEATKSA